MADVRIEIGKFGDPEDRARKGLARGPDTLQHLDQLAWMLDSSIQIPGLPFRLGVDSLLGLIPIIGDLIGAAISSYIILLASKEGAARVTLLRMSLNVAIESVVGIIPFVGDIFDIGWKANRRNVELLKAHLKDPVKARRTDWVFAFLMIGALLILVTLLAWAALFVARGIFRYLQS